jgi:inner membrane protein
MPSPVGHILGGVAVYLAGTSRASRSRIVLTVTLLGSICPDFDFLPGIAMGNMSAFHHGISHSLTFAVLFGAIVFVFVRRVEKALAVQASILAALAYASHVILDFVAVNEGTRGVPVLWPLSDEKLGYSLHLFGYFQYSDIRHGIASVVRWENLVPVLRELTVIGSLVLLFLWKDKMSSYRLGNRFQKVNRSKKTSTSPFA